MKRRRLLLLLGGVALLILGVYRLHLNVEVLDLLPQEEPVVAGLKLYQQHFSNARELIITLKTEDRDSSEQAAASLAAELRAENHLVASVMWQPGWMENPAQAAELVAYLWFNQAPAEFAALTNRLTGNGIVSTLNDAKEQLATSLSPLDLARRGYDPFNLLQLPEHLSTNGVAAGFGDGNNLFASEDGTFRMMFVRAAVPLNNYRACRAWLGRVDEVIAKARSRSPALARATVAYTGAPAFVTEIAGGMEFDTTLSVTLTSAIIAVLFWISHRRWRPVLWLLVLLAAILACTLALGGLVFGAVNVVSLGFAAILLGLAVDYAVVHYQEAISSPRATIPEIRRAIGPSIFWAATTTISAFLVLNLAGMPGLAQLGTLVAIGVGVSALVMIYAFLPPLFRNRMQKTAAGESTSAAAITPPEPKRLQSARVRMVLGTSLVVVLGAGVIVSTGLPRVDRTADALRSRNSRAHAALEEIKNRLTQGRDPLWIITRGGDATEIGARLDRATSLLNDAVARGLLTGFTLPAVLWPKPQFQSANRPVAKELAEQREALRRETLAEGFTSNSFALTDAILSTWNQAGSSDHVYWPTNDLSRWILDKVVARSGDDLFAVGLLYRTPTAAFTPVALAHLQQQLSEAGFILSGWELLGPAILHRVQGRLWWMAGPMVFLVGLSLWLAFRRPREILLSLSVLALSALCLLAIMRAFGWSWNLMNLVAVPLMLGTGVDYSIFTILALRRHGGDIPAAYRSVGRALLLCGGTAVSGFGTLGLSSNAGMSSLGIICATGIGLNMLISVYLLPTWWRLFAVSRGGARNHAHPVKTPRRVF